MGRIQVLSEHVANLIAAGEVVERPASVVKELVENAIDAGSKRIDIWLEEGGLQLIRVLDQGSGIEMEDCELAFLRHATSKIKSSKDLYAIRTLGFRGEALSSIASVSRLTCITSASSSGLGCKIQIEGGKLISLDEVATNQGTDMIVRDLFYQTPARLKYMKTLQTELNHISDYVYRLALAHPDIAFSLQHQGNTWLKTYGHGDILQVVAAIYGTTVAKQMVAFQAETLDYVVKGLVAKPEMTRANRNAMSFFVNGRYIRNYALQQAVIASYHTLLPIHRYPFAVIDIHMEPSLVDVNVHPAKLEVRFSKEQELMELLQSAISKLWNQQVLIPQVIKQPEKKEEVIQQQLPISDVFQASTSSSTYLIKPNLNSNAVIPMNESDAISRTSSSYLDTAMQSFVVKEEANTSLYPAFPSLSIIGQMKGTYLIAQNEQGLYLIDQHAAHERIQYEYFIEKFAQPEFASQTLLVPITLTFTAVEAKIIRDKSILFEQIGIYLEPFGPQAFLVRACPDWFPQGEEQALIEEMCEWVFQEKKAIQIREFREKSAILCACKSSIKANQSITMLEMETLIRRLSNCKNPYTCPHGRPIVICFTNYELEKMFKRVM